jgi:hypothetical protein
MRAALLDKTDVALLFAVNGLRATVASSRPFVTELQTAESLAEQRPESLAALRTLDEHAARGIPSFAALVHRFSLLAGDLRRDEAAERAGENSGGVEAALAATDTALSSEDLAAAVSALKRLESSRTESVRPWIREAEARLKAETTLAALDAALARRLRESDSPSAAKP